ncbi:VOC family protein [Megasphaera vaginalis (ex Bordigoni et al. 2020)]|uniref:VOC family protein n=1 Tax=Megasphaera vaginalis (ex Bordigoni et al. 2020) TaxID=2045301 RepID=UPI000C7B2443|nr:VOC family protein [Megasphaera vaginalis (ex Bordigoni et al. 2020)]
MKKPLRMHHVGIVLPTLQDAKEFINRMGLEIDYSGYVQAYHADLIFTTKGENSSPIEFIIPHEGVLCEFNHGKGGIAHLAFEVEDVEETRREYEAQGYKMLEKAAVQGTDDIIVNFMRPSYNNGILVEFVQTVAPINRETANPFQSLHH